MVKLVALRPREEVWERKVPSAEARQNGEECVGLLWQIGSSGLSAYRARFKVPWDSWGRALLWYLRGGLRRG